MEPIISVVIALLAFLFGYEYGKGKNQTNVSHETLIVEEEIFINKEELKPPTPQPRNIYNIKSRGR